MEKYTGLYFGVTAPARRDETRRDERSEPKWKKNLWERSSRRKMNIQIEKRSLGRSLARSFVRLFLLNHLSILFPFYIFIACSFRTLQDQENLKNSFFSQFLSCFLVFNSTLLDLHTTWLWLVASKWKTNDLFLRPPLLFFPFNNSSSSSSSWSLCWMRTWLEGKRVGLFLLYLSKR